MNTEAPKKLVSDLKGVLWGFLVNKQSNISIQFYSPKHIGCILEVSQMY